MTKPTPLVIAATSGAVTELVGIVQNPRPGSPRYAVTALVGEGALLREISDRLAVPLLDDLSSAAIPPGTHIAITAGNHLLHQQWLHIAMARKLEVATLIHADTTIGPWVEIGMGCVIAPGVRVTGNVTIGAHCQLHTGAIVSHDDVLGDYVTLSPSTTLCGSVIVGARSTIFAGATVMPNITIGADVIVGAGAMVNRDIADGTTVVGVPARPLQSSGTR
jgi:sugar O-acyltransferase (sialic acid O-acetyltransferase NeuD family)